jgi:hypothetical protein
MYAFEQDVPINAEIHAQILDGLGDVTPEGLLAHIAIEREDGTLRYVDLWRSREDCDRFTDERLHPVVGRALAEAGIRPDGEPPRRQLTVVDLWGEGFPREARV